MVTDFGNGILSSFSSIVGLATLGIGDDLNVGEILARFGFGGGLDLLGGSCGGLSVFDEFGC